MGLALALDSFKGAWDTGWLANWPFITGAIALLLPIAASIHIVHSKDDVRAAIGWVGLVWFLPALGVLLYFAFGVNRIQRHAIRRRKMRLGDATLLSFKDEVPFPALKTLLPIANSDMEGQAKLMDQVVEMPLTSGNMFQLLEGGDVAYEAMLSAINKARRSIYLETYIFSHDTIGTRFMEALIAAHKRGVLVCVLVDAVGEAYVGNKVKWSSITRKLREAGVSAWRFNHSMLPWRIPYWNLRNHRKICVIDDHIGFTGGMNISDGNTSDASQDHRIKDIHIQIEGPIVEQMFEAFANDWAFVVGVDLDFNPPTLHHVAGSGVARGIADGPDLEVERLKWSLLAAIGMAQKSIRIMTPYFLPDRILISALNHAALRGVKVEILLPEENNLRLFQWASHWQYRQLLTQGCHIYHVPPPFHHAKLFLVDDCWSFIGSGNWDARSYRLNFEFNIEVYDAPFTQELLRYFCVARNGAKRLTIEEWYKSSWARRIRNGFAWLLSPYL